MSRSLQRNLIFTNYMYNCRWIILESFLLDTLLLARKISISNSGRGFLQVNRSYSNGSSLERHIVLFVPLDCHWTASAMILRSNSTNLLVVFRLEEVRQYLKQKFKFIRKLRFF